MTVVEIENLRKDFGSVRALDGISLRIDDGEWIAKFPSATDRFNVPLIECATLGNFPGDHPSDDRCSHGWRAAIAHAG